jgi:radical SAM superfamily enzyme YgiQ (UPF0313 family)
MVKANFLHVFVGIESPSKQSLAEAKKLQNLSQDPIESIKILQRGGLWVTGGFILGFDSDTEDIFEQQILFIERAAVPWAMINFLHAVPRTALYDRMKKEGRLTELSVHNSDCTPPNFQTVLPPLVLLKGFQKTLTSIYDPTKYYERAWRSLQFWQTRNCQRPAQQPGWVDIAKIMLRSIWHQGLRSSYRRAYWKYLLRLVTRCSTDPAKIWVGCTILIAGHHFIPYATEVVQRVEDDIAEINDEELGQVLGEVPETGNRPMPVASEF